MTDPVSAIAATPYFRELVLGVFALQGESTL